MMPSLRRFLLRIEAIAAKEETVGVFRFGRLVMRSFRDMRLNVGENRVVLELRIEALDQREAKLIARKVIDAYETAEHLGIEAATVEA